MEKIVIQGKNVDGWPVERVIEEIVPKEQIYNKLKEALKNSGYKPKLVSDGVHATIVELEPNLEDIAKSLSKKGSYFINLVSGGIGEWMFDRNGYIYDRFTNIQWTIGLPASLQSSETLIAITNLLTDK